MNQQFGGNHTIEKLQAVEAYLNAYTIALSKQRFELVYFDAFAGSGSVDLGETRSTVIESPLFDDYFSDTSFSNVEDAARFIEGSAIRALQIERPFDRYVFVEKKRKNFEHLQRMVAGVAREPNRIKLHHDDANSVLEQFCRETNWRNTRAIVFLDPFGSQVSWSTIETIAKTKAIDLWYLFPSFLSVFRQISNEGKMTPEQKSSICRLMGTDSLPENWVVSATQPDLFSAPSKTKKQVQVEDITRYMINRMSDVFEGGVLETWLPLGKNGSHWYSLLFAWANPSKPAKELAKKLARACMMQD